MSARIAHPKTLCCAPCARVYALAIALWSGGLLEGSPAGTAVEAGPSPGAQQEPAAGPETRHAWTEPADGRGPDEAAVLAAARKHLDAGEATAALALLDRALAEVPVGLAGHRAARRRGELLRGLEGLPLSLGVERWLGPGSEDPQQSRAQLFSALERIGRMGPAARHLGAGELFRWAQVEFESEALCAALVSGLELPGRAARLACADLAGRLGAQELAMGRAQHGRATQPPPPSDGRAEDAEETFPGQRRLTRGLVERALIDREPAVRKSAALALGALEAEPWALAFERALSARDWTLRQHASEALAHTALEAGEGALLLALARSPAAAGSDPPAAGGTASLISGRQRAYVSDFDVEVATGQSIADPRIDVLFEGAALWVEVCHVESRQQAFRRQLRAALEQLRGTALPADFGALAAEAEYRAWAARRSGVETGGASGAESDG
jgi:hypothetical protein